MEAEIRITIQSLDDPRFGDFIGGWRDTISWDVTPEIAEERKAIAAEHMASMLAKPVMGGGDTLRLVEVTTTIIKESPRNF